MARGGVHKEGSEWTANLLCKFGLRNASNNENLLAALQEEYKQRKPGNKRFQLMTRSDLHLYSVTG